MRVLGCAALLLAAIGCGGSVDDSDAAESTPRGTGGTAAPAEAGSPSTGGAGGAPRDSGGDTEPFRDPGCPEVSRVPGVHACDPFSPIGSSCGFAERCIPYVEYADDCGTEIFGTRCVPTGTGVQGDECNTAECGAGFVCVATGEGNQCSQLCDLTGLHDCPPGLLCEPLDVDGSYVCM